MLQRLQRRALCHVRDRLRERRQVPVCRVPRTVEEHSPFGGVRPAGERPAHNFDPSHSPIDEEPELSALSLFQDTH